MTVKRRARVQARPDRTRDAPRSPLVSLWDWRASNQHLFPSDPSLRWHLRHHRAPYIDAGALLEIGGRFFVDAPKFESVLREVGSRIAAGRAPDPVEPEAAT